MVPPSGTTRVMQLIAQPWTHGEWRSKQAIHRCHSQRLSRIARRPSATRISSADRTPTRRRDQFSYLARLLTRLGGGADHVSVGERPARLTLQDSPGSLSAAGAVAG